MNSTALFSMALGLQAPWQVNDISFSAEASSRKELHLRIGFARGSRFPHKTGAGMRRVALAYIYALQQLKYFYSS